MTFRRFFALLLAMAMTFAPLGMPAMAEAQLPAADHAATAGQGHCDEAPKPQEQHKGADKSCCAAMCVAVVVPHGANDVPDYHGPSERPSPDRFRLGFLGEIATPPPKAA